MQPDLLGLEISKGELRRLTGFDPDDVFRPAIIKDQHKRNSFFLNELFIALALTPLIVGFIYAFLILPWRGSSIGIGIVLLVVVPLAIAIGRSLWRRKTCPKALSMLLDEVDKYHAVVAAIDVHDQLESVNSNSLRDREQVINALQLIRQDLVKALKTEKILRNNQETLGNYQELFTNNLDNLQAFTVSNQAGEYSQLLNQSLQIAIDVQAEIRKLQAKR